METGVKDSVRWARACCVRGGKEAGVCAMVACAGLISVPALPLMELWALAHSDCTV